MRPDLVCEKNVLVILVRIVGNPEMMRKHWWNFQYTNQRFWKGMQLTCSLSLWVSNTRVGALRKLQDRAPNRNWLWNNSNVMLVDVKDVALTYDKSQDPLRHSQRPVSLKLKGSEFWTHTSDCTRFRGAGKSPRTCQRCHGRQTKSRMCISNIR